MLAIFFNYFVLNQKTKRRYMLYSYNGGSVCILKCNISESFTKQIFESSGFNYYFYQFFDVNIFKLNSIKQFFRTNIIDTVFYGNVHSIVFEMNDKFLDKRYDLVIKNYNA